MNVNKCMEVFYIILFILIACIRNNNGEKVLTSFSSTVGAGNSSFYSLHEPGEITLILDSLEGDADLYVSEKNKRPDYQDYDILSVTCGRDFVTIPASFVRPTSIAVYGHIHSPLSKFKLTAIVNFTGDYDKYSYSHGSFLSSDNISFNDGSNQKGSWGPFLWDVLEFMLSLLFDILL